MKQGRASVTNYDPKTEPISHAVNVEAVAEIGLAQGRVHTGQMFPGRGYEAPCCETTIHDCGSQGKHK